MTVREQIRAIEDATRHDYHGVIKQLRMYPTIGAAAFYLAQYDRDDLSTLGLTGWPECQCGGCGCSEPATTTDDGGVPVCAACVDYTLDDDGQVVCSQCTDDDGERLTETVTESCGAGNQTRSFTRLKPPAMPETDADGEWA